MLIKIHYIIFPPFFQQNNIHFLYLKYIFKVEININLFYTINIKLVSKNIFILFELQRADINSLWDPVPFLTKVDYISKKNKEILENKEPLTIKDLDIDGSILIKELDLKPGKVLGDILNYLLEKVLDDKNLNSKDKLINLSKSYLNNLNDSH